MSKVEAQNGVCPDGYKHVFGKVCVSCTTLEKTGIDDVTLPDVPEFTDAACESAVKLLNQTAESLNKALEVPRKLMRMAKKILNYPAELVSSAVAGALGALSEVGDSIDDLLSGPEKLKKALERALDCPYIADSELGKSISGMLDTLDTGADLADKEVEELKKAVSSSAEEMVDGVMETPLGALSNLNRQYKSIIKSMGVEELLTALYELEKCVDDICRAYRQSQQFIDRLPKSGDDIVNELGAVYDKEKHQLSTSLSDVATEVQKDAAKAASDLEALRASFKKV